MNTYLAPFILLLQTCCPSLSYQQQGYRQVANDEEQGIDLEIGRPVSANSPPQSTCCLQPRPLCPRTCLSKIACPTLATSCSYIYAIYYYLFCCPHTYKAAHLLTKNESFKKAVTADRSHFETITHMPSTLYRYMEPGESLYFENSFPWALMKLLHYIRSREGVKATSYRKQKVIELMMKELPAKDLIEEILIWVPYSEELDEFQSSFVSFPYLKITECCKGFYLLTMTSLGISSIVGILFLIRNIGSMIDAQNALAWLTTYQGARTVTRFSIKKFNTTYKQLLMPLKEEIVELNQLCWGNMSQKNINPYITWLEDWSQQGAYMGKYGIKIRTQSPDLSLALLNNATLWDKNECPTPLLLAKNLHQATHIIMEKSLASIKVQLQQSRREYIREVNISLIAALLFIHALVAGTKINGLLFGFWHLFGLTIAALFFTELW